jgi:uroporphyrinogen-III decarboxylase
MRRLDQYLVDILVEPDAIHDLHDRIESLLEVMIRNYAEAGADSVMFAEDWGTQSQTLVSPDLWHEEFFPRYERLCGIAADCGIRVFMHSCGQIEAIVPGLMEAGISLLQFDQPALHGIDTLAQHQRNGRITFWCPVDIQTTLQTKDEETIRGAAREMLEKLWSGRGGFVAGYYEGNEAIGLDPKWQQYACDEFVKRGIAANHAV